MHRIFRLRNTLVMAAIFGGFGCCESSATTILAIRTANEVVVVADSKPTYRVSAGDDKVCKIHPLRSGFVAIGGLDHDSGRGFDTKILVLKAFDSSGTFSQKIARADRFVRKAAEVELRSLKLEDHSTYEFTIHNKGNVIELLFVTVEKNIPRIAARQFHFDERTAAVSISKSLDCPGRDCPQGLLFVKAGEFAEIDKFFSTHKNPHLDDVVLRDLLQQQIAATPNKVGPPVEILRIDSGGATWIANELGCPLKP